MSLSDKYKQATPYKTRTLQKAHKQTLVTGSSILPGVVRERAYYSLKESNVRVLVSQGVVPAYVLRAESWMGIPIYRPDGRHHGDIIRLFKGPASAPKYVWPAGQRNAMDIHPLAWDLIDKPDVPLVFVEGVKKEDSVLSQAIAEGIEIIPIGLNGAWGWKISTDGGSLVSPDLLDLPLHKRQCYIIGDSDYRSNDLVRQGFDGLSTYLSSKKDSQDENRAKVLLVAVPPSGVGKQGADDYFVSGGSLASLLSLGVTPRYFAIASKEQEEQKPVAYESGLTMFNTALEKVPHMVEPILPEGSILLLAGHSGSYKTWHAIKLMLDGAFGFSWTDHPGLGQPGKAFKSIYVNKEMSGAMMKTRLRQLAKDPKYAGVPDWHNILDKNIFCVQEPEMNLAEPIHRARLEAFISEVGAQLIILDSFSMCWTGDENKANEVADFYMHLRGITERTGVCWGLVHHLVKPQGRKDSPDKHTVRGSGQIVQQADSILLFTLYEEDEAKKPSNTAVKEIIVTHTKTRTSMEMDSWMTTFDVGDGLFYSLRYIGLLKDRRASEYTRSHGSSIKFEKWAKTALARMPAMLPTGSGLRTKQLSVLLTAAWPELDGEKAPSDSTIQRQIKIMADTGDLEMLDVNKKLGNLYRWKTFPVEVTGEDEQPEK